MLKRLNLLLICLCLLLPQLQAQFPKDYFAPPLDIPLYLSGNFAELRSNHFHTGLDMKTQNTEGKNVLAAADGVVSRISISPWGYGKAVYIRHPNGYTTVYGHLSRLMPKLQSVVHQKQLTNRSYTVDFEPLVPIPVSKGEIIALSGNTGGSGGPHLHFEIRKTGTDTVYNPLLFGFDIKDNLPPRIRGIRFYPLSDSSLVDGKPEAKSYVISGSDGKYHLSGSEKITTYGPVGIAVHTVDFLNGYPNICGIYSMQLNVDDTLRAAHHFDHIRFSHSREINCYKDYELFHKNYWHYHKSFREPGNTLEIYDQLVNEGILEFYDDSLHLVNYLVTDAYGNESRLSFTYTALQQNPQPGFSPDTAYAKMFIRELQNSYQTDDFAIQLPQNALYNDLKFTYSVQPKVSGAYSAKVFLQNDNVPLDKYMEVRLKLKDLPEEYRDKILLVRANLAGREYPVKAHYENGYGVGYSKNFGSFVIKTDLTKPVISVGNTSPGASLAGKKSLIFNVRDNYSGIASIDAWLNDRWIVMEFEPKKAQIEYFVRPEDLVAGDNTFKLVVTDVVGNTAEYKAVYKN